MTRARAYALRALIERAAASLPDEDALDGVELFPAWMPSAAYEVGQRIRYDGVLYKVLQSHTSQDDWPPNAAVSLYAVVLIPDPEVIPEWIQPGSTNPYMAGDKVTHNGKTWVSDIDNNVWEPGIYGWSEVS